MKILWIAKNATLAQALCERLKINPRTRIDPVRQWHVYHMDMPRERLQGIRPELVVVDYNVNIYDIFDYILPLRKTGTIIMEAFSIGDD